MYNETCIMVIFMSQKDFDTIVNFCIAINNAFFGVGVINKFHNLYCISFPNSSILT